MGRLQHTKARLDSHTQDSYTAIVLYCSASRKTQIQNQTQLTMTRIFGFAWKCACKHIFCEIFLVNAEFL